MTTRYRWMPVLAMAVLYLGSAMRAWAEPCDVGPGLQETADYIAKMLHEDDSEDYGLQWDTSRGTVSETWNGKTATAQLSRLDCTRTAAEVQGRYYMVGVRCAGADSCVFFDRRSINCFGMMYGGSEELAWRLARAYSHLIYLLQKQFKESHTNDNDPFARPPG